MLDSLEEGSLFPPLEGDYQKYSVLLKSIESLDATCFYGRPIGFQVFLLLKAIIVESNGTGQRQKLKSWEIFDFSTFTFQTQLLLSTIGKILSDKVKALKYPIPKLGKGGRNLYREDGGYLQKIERKRLRKI